MACGTDTTKAFQERLETLIRKSGKDIKELSKGIGISTGALSKYQNDAAEAGINALKKIANYFRVSCDWLLGEAETRTAENEAIYKRLGITDPAIARLADAVNSESDLTIERLGILDLLLAEQDFWFLIELFQAFVHEKDFSASERQANHIVTEELDIPEGQSRNPFLNDLAEGAVSLLAIDQCVKSLVKKVYAEFSDVDFVELRARTIAHSRIMNHWSRREEKKEEGAANGEH